VRSSTRQTGVGHAKSPSCEGGEGTVRIGGTLGIPTVLRNLGADPAEVLAEVGLDLALFDDPDNRISYVARSRLLRHCVARTGCRHFGLLLGEQGHLRSFGLVGLLVRYSPDVETALRSLVRYLHLHVLGAVASLEVTGNVAMLGYKIYQPHTEAADQLADGAVAMALNFMRELCGPEFTPIEAVFSHRASEDVGPFRRLFRAPLRFDAEDNALVFAADWLRRPIADADADVRRLLQQQIDALEARHGDAFAEQVRSVLRTVLLTHDASAERVASIFAIHSRTLSRRLAEQGTRFQNLVDEGRFEIARQMLEHTAMDVSEIAGLLVYADASAFTRAFRRWSGTTPAQWRAERRAATPRRQ
jgi:AraC-like DNA-binding protein